MIFLTLTLIFTVLKIPCVLVFIALAIFRYNYLQITQRSNLVEKMRLLIKDMSVAHQTKIKNKC